MATSDIARRMLPFFLLAGPGLADVQITIQPATRHQTIIGWGASSWTPRNITPELRLEMLKEAVDAFGLTRLRLEPPGGNGESDRRWEWDNDDGDPEHIDWSRFNTSGFDERATSAVIPFKEFVEANNEPFNIYVSPSFFNGGSTGAAPTWLFESPGEYAEFAASLLLRLRDVHGIPADYYCILNEAGNDNRFWETVVARMIKAVGPRMSALDLPTRIQFPEAIDADTTWDFINALRNDSEIWPYIGLLTYHLYGNNSPRTKIRDFGLQRGIPTGQTEYMSLTMTHLYDDLTLGGTSVWEIYGLTSQFNVFYNRLGRQGQFWNFRQLLHYVRPGAVRIGATSADANLRVLAFEKASARTVVLINGTGARRAVIAPLPIGEYAVSCSVGAGPYQELGIQNTDAAGSLTVDVPSGAVMTVCPYAGSNLPPVPTSWQSEPEFLTQPSAAATLSATATDPELDSLSFAWSIASQPAGAAAAIGSPSSASTGVTGLSVPGTYVFTVTISDGSTVIARDVRVTVFTGNQPPMPQDVHNRNPVLLTLPQSSTTLRVFGWDLEKDPLTYQWEVVQQPEGASVVLGTPNATSCAASGMTVAGDYVFRVNVSDPTHTVSRTLTVPVYPTNTAPTISAITATPARVILPGEGICQLKTVTSDAEGDVISQWWTLVSAPAGTNPVIVRPGGAETGLTGLVTAGTYTFELTVVDRAGVSRQQFSVVAGGAPGDMDGDMDVDQEDFGLFQSCYTGSMVPQSAPACARAKIDGDTDVDQGDFDILFSCLNGANNPPASSCGS